jgi:hypothetical protein
MDPDPDPAIFIIEIQDAIKKLIFFKVFLPSTFYLLADYLWKSPRFFIKVDVS